MPLDLINPERSAAITLPLGTMQERFWRWVDGVTTRVNSNSSAIEGTGTPEAVEVASVGKYYIDTAAAQGQRLWYKQTGDGDTGWLQL